MVFCGHFVQTALYVQNLAVFGIFFSILHVKLFRILPCICKSVFKRVVPQLFFNLQNFRKCAKSKFFFLLSRKLHLLKGPFQASKHCTPQIFVQFRNSTIIIKYCSTKIHDSSNNDLKIDCGLLNQRCQQHCFLMFLLPNIEQQQQTFSGEESLQHSFQAWGPILIDKS